MSTQVMKRGATVPPLVVTLTGVDEAGLTTGVDLTTASEVMAIGVRNGVRVIERVVTGSDQGEIEMAWEAGDTDAIGYIQFEFKVTWSDGSTQTFPSEGFERVRISLDGAS